MRGPNVQDSAIGGGGPSQWLLRQSLQPGAHLPSAHDFDELGAYLKSAIADDQSQQLASSMGLVAAEVESVLLRLKRGDGAAELAPALLDLLTCLRKHAAQVAALGIGWQQLYECAAYQAALANFRAQIGERLLLARSQEASDIVGPDDFELLAWRTLGDGMLMIDMHEQFRNQSRQAQAGEGDLTGPGLARRWWKKLRGQRVAGV